VIFSDLPNYPSWERNNISCNNFFNYAIKSYENCWALKDIPCPHLWWIFQRKIIKKSITRTCPKSLSCQKTQLGPWGVELTSIIIEWIKRKSNINCKNQSFSLLSPFFLEVASEWFMEDLGSQIEAYDTTHSKIHN